MELGERNREQHTYYACLIRFWYADNAGCPVWRASLEEPGGVGQLYFEEPANLWAYLDAKLATNKDLRI